MRRIKQTGQCSHNDAYPVINYFLEALLQVAQDRSRALTSSIPPLRIGLNHRRPYLVALKFTELPNGELHRYICDKLRKSVLEVVLHQRGVIFLHTNSRLMYDSKMIVGEDEGIRKLLLSLVCTTISTTRHILSNIQPTT